MLSTHQRQRKTSPKQRQNQPKPKRQAKQPAGKPIQSGFAGDAPKTPSQALGGFLGGDAIDPPAPAQNIAQAAPATRPSQSGFAGDGEPPENHQTLSCVGFCDTAQPIPVFTATLPEPEPIQDEYTRQRDVDQPANYWDESQGEFIAQPIKTPYKPMVTATVNATLKALGTSTRGDGAVNGAP